MKIQHLIVACFAAAAMVSCGDSKEVKLAKETVKSFFKALKTDDSAKKIAYYPDFAKLPGNYKSDSISITSTETVGNTIKVKVHNRFTNIKSKLFEHDMDIFVTVNADKALITNSKGLYDAKEQELYSFAVKTGCINESANLNDVEMAKQLKQAGDLLVFKAQDLIAELRKQVPLSGLTWANTFGFGTGNAVVKNNSPYVLKYLKYKLFFTDDAGRLVSTDDGFVAYDTIIPGETRKFEFMAAQSAEAKHLDLQLVYDKYFLLDCLKSKQWTGKEYEDWKSKKGDK